MLLYPQQPPPPSLSGVGKRGGGGRRVLQTLPLITQDNENPAHNIGLHYIDQVLGWVGEVEVGRRLLVVVVGWLSS